MKESYSMRERKVKLETVEALLYSLRKNKFYKEVCTWMLEFEILCEFDQDNQHAYIQKRIDEFLLETSSTKILSKQRSKFINDNKKCYNEKIQCENLKICKKFIENSSYRRYQLRNQVDKKVYLHFHSYNYKVYTKDCAALETPNLEYFGIFKPKPNEYGHQRVKYPAKMAALNFNNQRIMAPLSISDCRFLARISSRVTHEFSVCSTLLPSKLLERLLSAFRHVSIFQMTHCKVISSHKINLRTSMKGCKIEQINITGSRGMEDEPWGNDHQKLYNFVKFLSSSEDLKNSLYKLQDYNNNLILMKAKERLVCEGFHKLQKF
ncbi:unnamed protein product [Moneuplotes crassus]|uniref:Uncharacterized protein n=1 Tax=Euplotes crassus TaxID=5936 RepID=A0AAD1XJY8_EUPCR|nr:unnamed protein product [Moneuplotes crassus]